MKNIIVRSIAIVAMWTLACTAMAAGYVGVSLGTTKIDACGGVANCDDTDTGWRLMGGYNFTDMLAVEVAYNDAGQVSAGPFNVDLSAWTVAAKAAKAINDKFSILGTLGYAHWKADSNFGGDDTGNDLIYSVGVQYNFSEAVGLRGEWGRINADDNVDQLSLGVVYSF